MTDSQSLFDVLKKATYTVEKMPVIDLPTINDACKTFKISDDALVESEYNVADALVKPKTNLTD